MILVDSNLLVYAYDQGSEHHEAAKEWLERVLSGPAPIGLPWVSVLAFLRITTNPKIYVHPFSVAEATAIVDAWFEQPTVRLVEAGPRHWSVLRQLLVAGQAKGPLATDAHLAALAIERGAILCTNDRDFTRFEGLRLEYPLLG